MNLLDTASLVVTPNGYKASKLYSIIPSDGSGDMTFARTGDTATRVNSSGLIETVLANKPRLDYTDSTCPKLLLEPQRTNLIIYSNDFDNAAWGKSNLSITANAGVSPDGTSNADKLIPNTTSTYHRIEQDKAVDASVNTMSVFAKADGYNYILLENGGNVAYFNISNGTIGNVSAGTASITLIGGYYRCVFTATALNTKSNIYVTQANGSNSFAGNGTSGVLLYGAQIENASYATSYIPTTTASVTRNADTCSKTSATALIGQTEGTIFLDYVTNNLPNDYSAILSLSDGTFNNDIMIYSTPSNKLSFEIVKNTSINYTYTTTLNVNSRYKIAVAYKANDLSIYINGIQINIYSSLNVPLNLSNIYLAIGPNNINLGNRINLNYNSIVLWKTRLQNAELATLTAL